MGVAALLFFEFTSKADGIHECDKQNLLLQPAFFFSSVFVLFKFLNGFGKVYDRTDLVCVSVCLSVCLSVPRK